MKEKKIRCETARNFSIAKVLEKFGHFPTRETEKEAWFLSPFRPENQASFKVSKTKNRWYDHGVGMGGNVIDLVCLITKGTVKEALDILGDPQLSFPFQQQPFLEGSNEPKIKIQYAKVISHLALREYLHLRGISLKTALKYAREVHYHYKGKNYFAIGLKNDSGGYELRNKYYKNSAAPKDYTLLKNSNRKLIITEGMFDLFTLLELDPELALEYDLMVLNSAAFVKKAIDFIEDYDSIELYLDHDDAGRKMTERLMAESKKCIDKSSLYKGYKDLNEKRVKTLHHDLGKGIQDVFLLPQKQSCFAPSGRKVKRK